MDDRNNDVRIYGLTPNHGGALDVYNAARDNRLEYIQIRECGSLLVNWANKNESNYTPLHIASLRGHADMVALLIQQGAVVDQPDKVGRTPLWTASQSGQTTAVKTLIDRGANIDQPDRWGTTPLYAASSLGHASVVSMLVDNGAKVNQEDNGGRTPYFAATNNGHAAVVAVFES